MLMRSIILWLTGLFTVIGLSLIIVHPNPVRAMPAHSSLPAPYRNADLSSSYTRTVLAMPVTATTVLTPETRLVTGTIGLGQIINVRIDGLKAYVAKTNKPPESLVPFINGKALQGLHPIKVSADFTQLDFYLERTAETRDTWMTLFHPVSFTPREITFSVGFGNEPPFPSQYLGKLIMIPEPWFAMTLIGFLLILGCFLWCARASDILRDSGPAPLSGRKTFSLGRTQMAFWFFLILSAFLFISIITWNHDTITASSLGLMGISAGTALGAAVIDVSKQTAVNAQIPNLAKQKTEWDAKVKALQAEVSNLKAGDPVLNAKNSELTVAQQQAEQIGTQLEQATTAVAARTSEGFLTDVLTDATGWSFHRFQIFVWTIVLGVIFVASVSTNLAMPEFSGTLLALMGISSGTYLGFKIPEQQT